LVNQNHQRIESNKLKVFRLLIDSYIHLNTYIFYACSPEYVIQRSVFAPQINIVESYSANWKYIGAINFILYIQIHDILNMIFRVLSIQRVHFIWFGFLFTGNLSISQMRASLFNCKQFYFSAHPTYFLDDMKKISNIQTPFDAQIKKPFFFRESDLIFPRMIQDVQNFFFWT
jgi:hypothetical protein